MINKGLIKRVLTQNDFAHGNHPLVLKMKENPIKFIQESTDESLLTVFPISQSILNKQYRGRIDKYRKGLLNELHVGSMRLEPEPEF